MRSVIKCPYYYFESALPPEMCATIIELGQQKIQEDATINADRSVDHKMRKDSSKEAKWLKNFVSKLGSFHLSVRSPIDFLKVV